MLSPRSTLFEAMVLRGHFGQVYSLRHQGSAAVLARTADRRQWAWKRGIQFWMLNLPQSTVGLCLCSHGLDEASIYKVIPPAPESNSTWAANEFHGV